MIIMMTIIIIIIIIINTSGNANVKLRNLYHGK